MGKDVIVYLKSLGYVRHLPSAFDVKRVYPFLSAVGATVADDFETENLPYVEHIAMGGRVFALAAKTRNMRDFRPKTAGRTLTGKGVGLCVIDTGISVHPDFCIPKNRIVAFKDVYGGKEEVYDDNGHGTFVAGVAAGGGVASGKEVSGVASEADIVAVKAIGKSGECGLFSVLDAMQWVVDNKDRHGIKVVCMSFGANPVDYADPLERGADVLIKNGITVVASAGNSGQGGVKSPGTGKKVLTVGSVDDNNIIAGFSSYGEVGGKFKPEIYAPGVEIKGVGQANNLYVRMSGTSVSAPYVAGAAALLYEKYPAATPWQIKKLLLSFSDEFGGVRVLNASKIAESIMK